jgi:glycosyltransferase involved in cell wall biosynthesis
MSLSVITPILNEATFLPFYLKSVISYADEIIILDGGSTDGSFEMIKRYTKKYNVRVYQLKQTGMPYSNDWNESKARNFLIEKAKGDWIANIDADEIFDDRIVAALPEMMSGKEKDVYEFPFTNFWHDLKTIRVNAPGDERWSNDIIRMWRNRIGIHYKDEKHHCTLQGQDLKSIWKLPRLKINIPLFHYHYAMGKGIKFNDNRRGDVNLYDNKGKPNWNFRHGEYEICTQPFQGRHPSVIRKYLRKIRALRGGTLEE